MSLDDLYKVCPECGGEYRLEIAVCADCGVPLVLPEEVPEKPAPAHGVLPSADAFELPPSDDLVCICCRQTDALQILAGKLNAAGLAYWIDLGPYLQSLEYACLYVMPADADAAAALDEELFEGEPIEAADPEELATCPACGVRHSPGARECESCGLNLGDERYFPLSRACERCGAVVAIFAGPRCPNCGATLPAREEPIL